VASLSQTSSGVAFTNVSTTLIFVTLFVCVCVCVCMCVCVCVCLQLVDRLGASLRASGDPVLPELTIRKAGRSVAGRKRARLLYLEVVVSNLKRPVICILVRA